MELSSFHSTLTALEFDTFCNDYGKGDEFGPELPGPNYSIRDLPNGKICVYARIHISQLIVLGASQISHFEISCRTHGGVPTLYLFCRFYLAIALPTRVNSSVAPIAMCWFDGKDFSRDSFVDGFDDDMTLETLLNDNPTRIRRYLEEFLVLIGLSRMWYAPKAHPVFMTMKLNRVEMRLEDLGHRVCFKGAERHATSGSGRAPILVSSTVSPSRSVAATKARKFVPAITSAPAKRLESSMKGIGGRSSVSKKLAAKKGILVIKPPASTAPESDVGSSYDIVDDLDSSEAGSGHLVSFKEFIKSATSLSSASTRS
ncbi:hypothetical protein Tco_1292377 [Tanacetum coccineum]